MTPQWIGVIGLFALLAMIMGRVPVGIAMGVVGVVGYAAIDGWKYALLVLGQTPFDLAAGYSFSVVPLFILMGAVASGTGMAGELFKAANSIFSGRRGALAMATIGASAGLASISGSSLATAATLSRIAIPEMLRYDYDQRIATGSVASGGTLGILIPPSVILIIYAVIAEQSVPQLFAAALFPGLVLVALNVVVIDLISRLKPNWMPTSASLGWRNRIAGLVGMWKLVVLFSLAVGGIYIGWFSPTEAAAVSAFGAIIIGVVTRTLSWSGFLDTLMETVWTTAMLFLIILGAFLFSYFIVQTRLPIALVDFVSALELPPYGVILLLLLFYVVLGCVMEALSIVLITVPVFLPLIQGLGYSPVWFGVLLVVVVEVGLITPPVGLNLFVIRAQMPQIKLETIYRGIIPFLGADTVLLLLLLFIPKLALWFPELLY